jgi:hypothetical protein
MTMTYRELIAIIQSWGLDKQAGAIVLGIQKSRLSESSRLDQQVPLYVAYSAENLNEVHEVRRRELINERLGRAAKIT